MKKEKSTLEKEINIRAKKVNIENEEKSVYEERKPEFNLSENDLEDIKDWEVGKKYTITMEVENISKEKGMPYYIVGNEKEKKDMIRSRFKIISIKSKKDTTVDKYKDKFKR